MGDINSPISYISLSTIEILANFQFDLLRRYNMLFVGDDEPRHIMRSCIVERLGHRYHGVNNIQQAINFLKDDKDLMHGVPNHRNIAAIFCDWDLPDGKGGEVLSNRNALDHTIPFYMFGRELEDATYLAQNFLDGYLQEPFTDMDLENLIISIFADNVKIGRKVIMFKMGGSANDYTLEKENSSKIIDVLNFFIRLQRSGEYQVVLTTGGGERTDYTKSERDIFGIDCPEVLEGFSYQMMEDLIANMKSLVRIMGRDNAMYITPGQMTGREPIDITEYGRSPVFWRAINPERLFDQDKVIVMAAAPRHLGLNFPDIVPDSDKDYPNILPLYSDAHTVLIANLLNVERFGLVKRTDRVYAFDPLKGYGDSRLWLEAQKDNRPFDPVSCKELLESDISRKGAFDGHGGHLFDDPGLKLFERSLFLREIGIIHISPYELYLEGEHIVTGQPMPQMTEKNYRRQQLQDFVEGKGNYGRIVK